MSRPKKNAKILNIRLDSRVYSALENYATDYDITKTLAVERILEKQFQKEGYMPKKLDSSIKR